MFSAVFFVSIGLLIDPILLAKYAGPILIITAVVVIGQVTACTFGTFIAGHERQTALRVGMGLAQIGEFSFIIASLGLTLKVTSEFLYPIAVAVSALTTFITPYLLRSSDRVVGWFDRAVPAPVRAWLDLYTRWVEGLRTERSFAMGLVRQWSWQIALNLILVAGIFMGAASLRRYGLQWWPQIPRGQDGVKAALWLGAMLLSLPLLIALFRKLRALCMLLSEMSVTRSATNENVSTQRAIVANTILAAASVVLMLILILLSSAILPSWKLLVAQGLIVIATAILLRRSFTRLYSKAQVALQETLSQPPAAHREPLHALPTLLRESHLRAFRIPEHSGSAGKLIGELGLRTRTGASIVGIQRDKESLVNPGADEELRAGDEILLIGSDDHLASAEKLLSANAQES
jgi:CPA2 family monovalent cation:H+ antiporter-2